MQLGNTLSCGLSDQELETLRLLCEGQTNAEVEDWKTKLDAFLRFNDADVLQDKGKVTAAIAKEFAESEFEKYRVIQDSLYESDFDKLMNDMEKDGTTH